MRISAAVIRGKKTKQTKKKKKSPKTDQKKRQKTDKKKKNQTNKTALFRANNHQEKSIFQIVTSHKKV